MLTFCPNCGNVLFVPEVSGILKLECIKCPFVYNVASAVRSRTYCKLKVGHASYIIIVNIQLLCLFYRKWTMY